MSSHSSLELVGAAGEPNLDLGSQVIAFDIGNASYGIPIDSLVEVDRVPNVAPVPHSETWIRGVVNLRGSILTLIDLAALLQIGTWRPTPQSRMLVIGREDPVAISVDQLRGMRQFSESVSPDILDHMPGRVADYAQTIYREGDDFLTVLDIQRALDDADQASGRVHELLPVAVSPGNHSTGDHLPAKERGNS